MMICLHSLQPRILRRADPVQATNSFTGQEGIETDEAFFIVEVMPAFKGGDINKFREWVMRRTNYPQAAVDNRIQGKVYLTFIVETDGTVSNVTSCKGC